ncbi:hypothetical protein CDL52_08360 [Escherichia coli]|nr:hypothetical protein CDL30_22665 [Escherichia coli]OXJ51659.1 hypothetical protein CDL34_06550 [Escherichia coli]OXJ53693.1 hypothetical protein CDL53_22020 [Escherichia coli]OXJ61809.1 hypothetical protein CDL52_08360 [Escherichia coli]OXK16598.1 hypothetical protein CDL42_22315 [Escherichia coli]
MCAGAGQNGLPDDMAGRCLKAIHRTDNGIQTLATYEQDARGRLTEANARLDYHLFYEYDAADRIIRWSDTVAAAP